MICTPTAALAIMATASMTAAIPTPLQSGGGGAAPSAWKTAVPLQPGAEQIGQKQHKPDEATLRSLGLAITVAAPPSQVAQAAPAPANSGPPVSTGGRAMDNTFGTGTTPNSPLPVPGLNAPAKPPDAAQGGNPNSNNQAAAATGAHAPQPTHGANSFTGHEARARIAHEGFQNVGDLSKDSAGVWRGTATKNGQPVHVWLDYKGNVGQD